MGISNFTYILKSAGCKPSREISPYDSILIDIQSIIHSKLWGSLKSNRADLIEDTCTHVLRWLVNLLHVVLFAQRPDELVIVIAFDGAGVPMKWPTQQRRRVPTVDNLTDKDILKTSLFEHNLLSKRVYKCIKHSLRDQRLLAKLPLPDKTTVLLSSSKVRGEGEHKLFEMAQVRKCRMPIIFSIDNDVFVISFARRQFFDKIQVGKSEKEVYTLDLTDCERLLSASFLFGNDFIPEIIGINVSNVLLIHKILNGLESRELPVVVHEMAKTMKKEKKIRFHEMDYRNDRLLIEFWKNCLWILDYYSKSEFPQKFMENVFYDIFDRNAFLTAVVCDVGYLRETYERARKEYADTSTGETLVHREKVFSEGQLNMLSDLLLQDKSPGYVTEISWTKS